MEQEHLFFDGPHDALRHVVRALGGPKKVGHTLRAGKSPDDAGRWLSNALDGDRRETLHLEDLIQLLRMGREAGCHAGLHELCRAVGYSEPMPVEPEDQRAALEREFITAVQQLDRIQSRLESIQPVLRRVRG